MVRASFKFQFCSAFMKNNIFLISAGHDVCNVYDTDTDTNFFVEDFSANVTISWKLRICSHLVKKCLLNTERYSVSVRIQSECGKMRNRKLRIRTLFTQWLTSVVKIWKRNFTLRYTKWGTIIVTVN